MVKVMKRFFTVFKDYKENDVRDERFRRRIEKTNNTKNVRIHTSGGLRTTDDQKVSSRARGNVPLTYYLFKLLVLLFQQYISRERSLWAG